MRAQPFLFVNSTINHIDFKSYIIYITLKTIRKLVTFLSRFRHKRYTSMRESGEIMRLTMYTDFSLRMLIYLGAKDPGVLSTVQEIADSYNLSKHHLTKVAHELGKLGLIETVRGRGGGIRLKATPESINVGQLVRMTEDDFQLVECFNSESNRCILSPVCGLKSALRKALEAYFLVLDQYTIADFVVNKDQLASILFDRHL